MKKKISFFSAIPLIGFCLYAVSVQIEETYQEGEIRIENTTPHDEDVFRVKAGEKVEFNLPMYSSEFFGQLAIFANAEMTNITDKSVKAVYSISFYDEDDSMIGCHQGSWDLEADESIPYGSGIIFVNTERIDTVRYYRLRTLVLRN